MIKKNIALLIIIIIITIYTFYKLLNSAVKAAVKKSIKLSS